jgi:hypothetical protein
MLFLYSNSLYRAITGAVSRRLPTTATRVRFRVRSYGICGGQSDADVGFLLSPASSHSTSWYILSHVWVTYKTGSGLEDWIYCALYIHTVRDYRHYKCYRYCTHFPVHSYMRTRILILNFRIPATELSQSHCTFNSHMKCSWDSLIPFLSFRLNHLRLLSPELDPVLFRLLFCTLSALSPLHSCPAEHFF